MLALKTKTDIDIINLLLAITTIPDHQNSNDETALIIAIKNNHYWANLKDLIEISDCNICDVSRTNALMFGVKYKLSKHLLDILCEKTNLNHRNHYGFDIFELANRYGNDLFDTTHKTIF
jgi:ankyrin repeat protein